VSGGKEGSGGDGTGDEGNGGDSGGRDGGGDLGGGVSGGLKGGGYTGMGGGLGGGAGGGRDGGNGIEGGGEKGQPQARALSPAIRKLRPPCPYRCGTFGPMPLPSKRSLYWFVSAALPISVRTTTVKLLRRRNKKLTARSRCCRVSEKGLSGLPSSYETDVRGQSTVQTTVLALGRTGGSKKPQPTQYMETSTELAVFKSRTLHSRSQLFWHASHSYLMSYAGPVPCCVERTMTPVPEPSSHPFGSRVVALTEVTLCMGAGMKAVSIVV